MLHLHEIQKSLQDYSVNFIFKNNFEEFVESRIVIRKNLRDENHYAIFYLSSHDGCNKACRFCHLTQTKQTSFHHVTTSEYVEQAQHLMDYFLHHDFPECEKIHFNFMARGEPLANQYMLNNSTEIFDSLCDVVHPYFENVYFNISSIFPQEMQEKELREVFSKSQNYHVQIYYSLYSLNENFRKRWIPKAINPSEVFEKLFNWQVITQEKIIFHWAFIKDENDSLTDCIELIEAIQNYKEKLKTALYLDNVDHLMKFNLVRYNPFSNQQGLESEDVQIQQLFELIQKEMPHESKIVQRVGFDVKASCGMFIEK